MWRRCGRSTALPNRCAMPMRRGARALRSMRCCSIWASSIARSGPISCHKALAGAAARCRGGPSRALPPRRSPSSPGLNWRIFSARIAAPRCRFCSMRIRDGQPMRLTGRIDRLVIDDSGVMVIDYKSDASVPRWPGGRAGELSDPARIICVGCRSALPRTDRCAPRYLWTRLESLMFLPPEHARGRSKGFTMR